MVARWGVDGDGEAHFWIATGRNNAGPLGGSLQAGYPDSARRKLRKGLARLVLVAGDLVLQTSCSSVPEMSMQKESTCRWLASPLRTIGSPENEHTC